ncbi:MAG: hypothetical protein LBK61_08950 [Spirochaetaceae bacterium]|nr:hypothetical protein [Spirochaetaceae bacterium]
MIDTLLGDTRIGTEKRMVPKRKPAFLYRVCTTGLDGARVTLYNASSIRYNFVRDGGVTK